MKELEVYEPIIISNIYDLKRMCWSGAIQRIDEVLEMSEEKQDAFLQHVIDYGELMQEMDTLTTTNINDFIWFDCDDFIEELKQESEEN
jgi:hypothetical protein